MKRKASEEKTDAGTVTNAARKGCQATTAKRIEELQDVKETGSKESR